MEVIRDEAVGPKLLNLMPNCREEKKLELRLGLAPPGERHHHQHNKRNLNLGVDGNDVGRGLFFSSARLLRSNVQPKSTHFDLNLKDVKGEPDTTTTTTSSQKRTASGPVVGWPPIRSFRKNITATSINNCPKPPSSSHDAVEADQKSLVDGKVIDGENYDDRMIKRPSRSMFVKINMEGVAIGRKVDLGAYDTYDKLSLDVDVLFRDLLGAQRDGGDGVEVEEAITTTGVVGGRGEYTLVYEDHEGDRMLLGDVPWQ